ncbi:MAG: RpiB/LacA/LacB family sugar-phosphate isomerase [bacterium]|nr:RpiB/LacA/LacB family sugar-phosphate isomerase [bacterium]
MKIYIGTDHAGFALKEELKRYLPELGLGYEVTDLGSFTVNPDDDYPDFVTKVAEVVVGEEGSMGIVLGGSGQGEAMCANKVKGVRAFTFYGPKEMLEGEDEDTFQIVKLSREHNDANIISIGARFVTEDEAKFAIELFLSTKFSGEERHTRRINKF